MTFPGVAQGTTAATPHMLYGHGYLGHGSETVRWKGLGPLHLHWEGMTWGKEKIVMLTMGMGVQ